jgi:cellulose biosynthesis protein BcsQ
MGKKVLMIDADSQPSLSSYYKILEQAQGGLTEILTDPQNVNSYISKTQYGDLIYSNDHSNQLQPWLASKGDGLAVSVVFPTPPLVDIIDITFINNPHYFQSNVYVY